ncbi:MAG: 16S rRNA (guanine(527)-N(7))-methyltransferase RsmG [Bdellovibrionales bacterium]
MKPRRTAKGTHRKPENIYSKEEADACLYDLFRHHDFGDFPHAERHQLVEFYLLLMNHQMSDNVTRLVKFRDIGIKHFIDSLMVPRLTTLMFPLLDVGTGPGFPGIPLKIVYPKDKIILAEGVRRRVDFLKAVREEMGLKELQVVGRKIDDTFQLPVRGVITRALEEVSGTLKSVSQCLEVGGQIYLMKGPNVDPEIKKAKADWALYYELVEDHRYTLPNSPHDRRLLVYKKLKTPPLGLGNP